MHRIARRRDRRIRPNRGGIRIACKFDITAKRQSRDLPLRAPPIFAREQDRPKPDRKHIRTDARPPPDNIMTIFMDRYDD
jgi:hypothetical protein